MIQGKPTIYAFLGLPGSGKSYFARNLSEKFGIVRLNSDAMRMAIFGTRKMTTEIYRNGDRKILNSYVFKAIDYATEMLLANGQSVIQDANHNERSVRKNLEVLAARYNAQAVLVHVKTPKEVAIQRAQERIETNEQRKHTRTEIEATHSRMLAVIDPPEDSELVIVIDGMGSSEEQLASFEQQIGKWHV